MPSSILIPLEVYGYGCVIAFFMAGLIKVLMYCITKFSKNME